MCPLIHISTTLGVFSLWNMLHGRDKIHCIPIMTRTLIFVGKQNNPFVDPLFALSSPVVSVPTSGMQLAEAAEVFSAILSTVGLKKVNTNGDEVDFLTEVTLRAVACVNAVEVTLLTTSLSPGDDASEPQAASPKKQKSLPPVFMLDGLNILLNGTQRPSLTGPNLNDKRVSTDVVLSVSVERVHQHVNFALVRLILQIMETLDVIKEEEKFAAKEKPNEKQQRRNNEMMLRFAAANTNSAVWSPISSPGAALPKCWRNMYNVMNLYTTHPGDVTGPPPRNNAHSRQAGMQSRKCLLYTGFVIRSTLEKSKVETLCVRCDSKAKLAWILTKTMS